MDNREAAFRIKPAYDIHSRVRKIESGTTGAVAPTGGARNDAERIKMLQAQVDELGAAVSALAGYIAARDDINLSE
jgi:hypothetical protein